MRVFLVIWLLAAMPAWGGGVDLSSVERGQSLIKAHVEKRGVVWIIKHSKYFGWLSSRKQADIKAALSHPPTARFLLAEMEREGIREADLPHAARDLLALCRQAAQEG